MISAESGYIKSGRSLVIVYDFAESVIFVVFKYFISPNVLFLTKTLNIFWKDVIFKWHKVESFFP